jgi:hypothetical protein
METPFEITNNAIEQVKQNNLNYYNRVIEFAEVWVTSQMRNFTSEDLKSAFFEKGNELPRQPAVFGAVFRRLSREGLIFKNGFSTAKNKVAHCRILQMWISKQYRLKQQKNRITNRNQISIF